MVLRISTCNTHRHFSHCLQSFLTPVGLGKNNTMQVVKYPHVLSVDPLNKVYVHLLTNLHCVWLCNPEPKLQPPWRQDQTLLNRSQVHPGHHSPPQPWKENNNNTIALLGCTCTCRTGVFFCIFQASMKMCAECESRAFCVMFFCAWNFPLE